MTSAQATVGETLRSPSFVLYWLAQAISRFGDPITLIALAAASYRITGSALATSLAVIIATVPQATFGFFGGALADALGHRRAMVASDLVRAAVITGVPAVIALELPLAVAFALVIVAALAAAVFNPARFAVVPAIVPARQLGSANSLLYATDRAVEILGALAAGLLVAMLGDGAFYVDAATFAVSALLLTQIRLVEAPVRRVTWSGAWRDAAAGVSFIRTHATLMANTTFSLLAQLSFPVSNGLTPVLIFRRFADHDTVVGAQMFGIAEAVLAGGAVLAGLALPWVLHSVRKGRLLVGGLAAYGALLIGVSAAPTFELLLVVVFLLGVANMLSYVPNVTISQELTPPELRGRVFGARMSLLSLSSLPIVVAVGALADVVQVSFLIGMAGAFTLLVALAATQIRVVSDVP